MTYYRVKTEKTTETVVGELLYSGAVDKGLTFSVLEGTVRYAPGAWLSVTPYTPHPIEEIRHTHVVSTFVVERKGNTRFFECSCGVRLETAIDPKSIAGSFELDSATNQHHREVLKNLPVVKEAHEMTYYLDTLVAVCSCDRWASRGVGKELTKVKHDTHVSLETSKAVNPNVDSHMAYLNS
jgi:hypothetical protein